jgi:hypothetical protein
MEKEIKKGLGWQLPPNPEFVKIYFLQKGRSETEAVRFIQHFEASGWKRDTGNPIRNWKTMACDWIWELQHHK